MYAEGFYGKDGKGVQGSGLSSAPVRQPSFKEYCVDLADALDDLCAQMLAVGMPYDLYWHGEMEAVDCYLNSLKYKRMMDNAGYHLQGVYFVKALQEVLQFTKNPVEIYPASPLDLQAKPHEPTEEDEVAEMKAQFDRIRKGVKKHG